jgi:choline dehydrogenase-like flavoprotein
VIGTGAGGGPVAAVLAERGLRVVVLEAGPYVRTGEMTGDEGEMTARLYRMELAPASGHGALRGPMRRRLHRHQRRPLLPPAARDHGRWRDERGLTALTDGALSPFVEQAWRDVHAEPTDRAHASRNAARMADGARRLGWSGAPTPRNVIGCANLGLCNLGCPSGAKQSTLLAYVPRPAERAGARVLARTRAERIRVAGGRVRGIDAVTFDPATGRGRSARNRAHPSCASPRACWAPRCCCSRAGSPRVAACRCTRACT